MKKLFYLLAVVICAAFVVSCSKDDDDNNGDNNGGEENGGGTVKTELTYNGKATTFEGGMFVDGKATGSLKQNQLILFLNFWLSPVDGSNFKEIEITIDKNNIKEYLKKDVVLCKNESLAEGKSYLTIKGISIGMSRYGEASEITGKALITAVSEASITIDFQKLDFGSKGTGNQLNGSVTFTLN